MGRHVNADAELDEHPDVTRERLLHGTVAPPEHSQQGHPLQAQSFISPDTHIGSGSEVAAGTPDAAASPAHPDSLVQHGLVGDGHELE
ncbi:MAG: hypothetical protein M3N46_01425 [Actinomycetota bacterium]|nr:hypothetical protein [Actinomycetota bacterium]